MPNWDTAMMAMIGISTVGFMLSDGEKRRVRWVRAMRRCVVRMHGIIRYEQPPLCSLLERIDLRASQQERELTKLIHRCAGRIGSADSRCLSMLFAEESSRLAEYGVLSEEDRAPFENALAELGCARLPEQLHLLECVQESLRLREETLDREAGRRAQMMRFLGISGGAAVFLILI